MTDDRMIIIEREIPCGWLPATTRAILGAKGQQVGREVSAAVESETYLSVTGAGAACALRSLTVPDGSFTVITAQWGRQVHAAWPWQGSSPPIAGEMTGDVVVGGLNAVPLPGPTLWHHRDGAPDPEAQLAR